MGIAVRLDHQHLAQMGRSLRHQLQRRTLFPDRQNLQPAIGGALDRLVRPGIVIGPDHRGPVARHNLVKQTHLRFEITVHITMIVKMVAAQIGERADPDRQSFGAILRQTMA